MKWKSSYVSDCGYPALLRRNVENGVQSKEPVWLTVPSFGSGAPTIKMDEFREGYPLPPTGALKFGPIGKFANITHAKICDRHHVTRQPENR